MTTNETLNTRFMLIGPGVISGPWSEDDYHAAHQFAEDLQAELTPDTPHKSTFTLAWS